MHSFRPALALFAIVLLAACSDPPKPAASTGSSAPAASNTADASASSEAPPATSPGPQASAKAPPGGPACAAIREEAAAILASPEAADLACTEDAGCGCAPAIIDCGGVYSKSVADRLSELGQKRADGDCGYYTADGSSQFNCAPWQCMPRCIDSVCRNAP